MPEDGNVRLPGFGRTTSRLGFGTSGLAGELTYKESIGLLEAAFEAGIRHFDTAPIYGAGASERLLGDFVARRRSEVTLTTKFGLEPPRAQSLLLFGKEIIRPLLRRAPALKSSLAKSATMLNRSPKYLPESMRRSLDRSLKALRSDRVDLYLMHEADGDDISDEIRLTLDDAVSSGRIGAWGVGGQRDKIDRIFAHHVPAPSVLQFEWSPFSDRPEGNRSCFCIRYGAISLALPCFKRLLARPEMRRRWSDSVGLDLANPSNLPRLLVAMALSANPGGIVLFSTKKPKRIRDIASALHPDNLIASAKLLNMIRRETAMVMH